MGDTKRRNVDDGNCIFPQEMQGLPLTSKLVYMAYHFTDEEKLRINEIAELTSLPYSSAHTGVQRLTDMGIIERQYSLSHPESYSYRLKEQYQWK